MDSIRRLMHVAPPSNRVPLELNRAMNASSDEVFAALAAISPSIGRVILEAVLWPGRPLGPSLSQVSLALVVPELDRQAKRLHQACLHYQINQAAGQWSRRTMSAGQQHAKQAAEQNLIQVREETWPRNTVEHLSQIVQAIIHELTTLRLCPCGIKQNNGADRSTDLNCPTCRGLGVKTWCDRQRANALNCDHAGYSRRWKVVYEWIFVELLQALRQASSHFFAAFAQASEN